jgi:hypothetical protein
VNGGAQTGKIVEESGDKEQNFCHRRGGTPVPANGRPRHSGRQAMYANTTGGRRTIRRTRRPSGRWSQWSQVDAGHGHGTILLAADDRVGQKMDQEVQHLSTDKIN